MRRIGKAATSKVAVRKDLGVRVPLSPPRKNVNCSAILLQVLRFVCELIIP